MRTFSLLFLSFSFAVSAFGQAIDSSFGVNGVVIMPFDTYAPGNNDRLKAIAQQPDGKILATGNSYRLIRLNLNGTVDSSFGINGRVQKKVGSYGGNSAYAVLVQTDGKIVQAGTSYSPQIGPDNRNDFSAARFHADGTPDLSFNGTGSIGIDIQTAEQDNCNGALLQADGKMVMYGSSGNSIAIARLNTDGTLDNSFNGTGKFYTEYGIYGSDITSAVVCADGKIVACGNTDVNGDDRFLILKFQQNGHLDSTFGVDGAVITDFSGPASFAHDIALQADGKIVAAGRDLSVGGLLARYHADGTLDNSFGNAGKVEASISTGDIQPEQLVITADGSIFVAGHIYTGTDEDLYFAKYKSNGAIDSPYSSTGIIVQLSSGSERIHSMLLQHDGKILSAGYVREDQAYQFAMVRFTPFPVGIPDVSDNIDPLQLYPNPVKQTFVLRSGENGVFTIKNSLGQLIFNEKIARGINTLQFPQNTPTGIYNGIFESLSGNKINTTIIYTP